MSLTIWPTINYLPTQELFNIHAVGQNTRKRRGEVAEAAFLAKASRLGFAVAKPWGDSERYDFILDTGHKFLRIQVKSTERFAESRYRVKTSGWKDTYTRDEIDFIVVYIVPEDIWYVVPIEAAVGRKGLRFYPRGQSKSNGTLEKYREAWHLLRLPTVRRGRPCPRAGRELSLDQCNSTRQH
jgi:PD-(D/E)XK endonuclease